jgi:hypothetical protein
VGAAGNRCAATPGGHELCLYRFARAAILARHRATRLEDLLFGARRISPLLFEQVANNSSCLAFRMSHGTDQIGSEDPSQEEAAPLARIRMNLRNYARKHKEGLSVMLRQEYVEAKA